MKVYLVLLPLLWQTVFAQETEKSVSISCYVNPQLYIQAGVVAQVSDAAGNVSCNGRHVTFHNQSSNTFYYQQAGRWIPLKPSARVIVTAGSGSNASPNAAATYNFKVKYRHDVLGSVSTKLSAISRMNAQTDKVKAGVATSEKSSRTSGVASGPAALVASKNPTEKKAAPTPRTAKSPATPQKIAASPAKKAGTKPSTSSAAAKKRAVAKTAPRTPAKRPQSASVARAERAPASANSIGLRVDLGKQPIGVGPNFKHRFNRKYAIDAALVFYEGDLLSLGAQVQRHFAVRSDPGLNLYIGLGPQFFAGEGPDAVALVPVTGLEYKIPQTKVELAFDWRPNFYLSPTADVDAGRFGLSFRIGL
ncbi:hypothetical protein [Pedobacter sp. SYSU D00535]|uniref:hypothetical protein n=1 Tax=Pedobacter sp. SYSU D00535 TaxID=2810308 RepID=UPI001A968E33|nr:hypothetical protein [Pedobacter sp. SYSU D00535]